MDQLDGTDDLPPLKVMKRDNCTKSAGWLTTNHITGEKSRVLLIPILYKKRYAKVFDEKGKGYDQRSAARRRPITRTSVLWIYQLLTL